MEFHLIQENQKIRDYTPGTDIMWADRPPGVDKTLLIEKLSNCFSIESISIMPTKPTRTSISGDFRGSEIVVGIEDPPYDRNDVVYQLVFTFSL